MKQSQVKPGVVAMLSLGGRRGAVRVTVIRRALLSDMRRCEWVTEDSLGRLRHATSRQLQPMPHVACQTELAAAYDAHLSRSLRAGAAQPGQTIDAGDVIIETTLHRLG